MNTTPDLNHEVIDEFESVLDKVEQAGRETLSNVLDAYLPILGDTSRRKKKNLIDTYSCFCNLVRQAGRRWGEPAEILSRIMTPINNGWDTVSFYVRGREGGLREIRVKYSAYDVLEFMTVYGMVSSEEGRKTIIDTVLRVLETQVYMVDGRPVGLDEYLSAHGVSREEFEKTVAERLEESMRAYLDEIRDTKGSWLAKHIYLRQKATENPEASPFYWLLAVTNSVTTALATICARIVAARKGKVNKGEKEALAFYKYMGRFATVCRDLGQDALYHVKFVERERESRQRKISRPVSKIASKVARRVRHAPVEVDVEEDMADVHELEKKRWEHYERARVATGDALAEVLGFLETLRIPVIPGVTQSVVKTIQHKRELLRHKRARREEDVIRLEA